MKRGRIARPALYPLVRPLVFSVDPETAHRLALHGLKLLQAVLPTPISAPSNSRLRQTLWGLHFPNPIGLAAGYDKNAQLPLVWSALGFGFAELGTITAHAQPGNPKPRIFRLGPDHALINRLGFNNDGATAVAHRLRRILPPQRSHPFPLGLNIGKSRSVSLEQAVEDYTESCERLLPFADYVAVNVSSPNTPELRTLQQVERLGRLLTALLALIRKAADRTNTSPTPLLVKIGPDLHDAEAIEIARLAKAIGLSGLIATNTMSARPALRTPLSEAGGLSGKPIAERATEVLRILFRAVEGSLPLIAVGGIFSAADAYTRIRAGASLVQLYTGLIYEGPFLPRRIAHGLSRMLADSGYTHVGKIVGLDVG